MKGIYTTSATRDTLDESPMAISRWTLYLPKSDPLWR